MTPHGSRSLTSLISLAASLAAALALLLAVPASASGPTFVSGDQAGLWTPGDSPYIVTGSMTVNTFLTIQSGVQVLVRPGLSIVVNGSLTTNGTVAQRVVFSAAADTAGGSPAPGAWYGIFAQGGSTIFLEETLIHYGGRDGWANLSTSSGVAASITWNGGNAAFSAGDGVRITATDISLLGMGAFSNAADGIELNPTNPPSLVSLSSTGNGGYAYKINQNPGSIGPLLASTCGRNGVYVSGSLGGSAPDQTWFWSTSPTCPVIVGTLTVNGPDILEIAAGSVIKGDGTNSWLQAIGAGSVIRAGTTGGNEVWFTSIKDDSRSGDTNSDGAASSPAPGDWFGILANGGSSLDFERVIVQYGGSGGWGSVSTSNGVASSIAWNGGGPWDSGNDGMRVSATEISLASMDVHRNAVDGIEISPTNPPTIGAINANTNGGYVLRVMQNPGSFAGPITGSQNAWNGVYVTGTLGGSAPNQMWSWAANPAFPYVIDQVTCNGPDSLEIAAGAVVKYAATSSYLNIIGAGAHLRTLGTSQLPVSFTSRKDDSVGGDTNNDGNATSPAGGDGYGIFVNGSSTLELNNTYVAYGGFGGYGNVSTSSSAISSLTWNGGGALNSGNDGVRVTTTSASFSNMIVSGNAADGIDVSPTVPATFDQITANYNGGYGIRVAQNPGSFSGTIGGSGNAVNGIYVTGTLGGSAADQKWSWGANPTFPYVIHQVTCNGPDSLEIAAGAVVKYDATSSYLNIIGASAHLRTLGTSESPVWFTSRKDDSVGGDTNNDGNATSPAGGDGYGILVNGSSTIELNGTHVAYGGSSGWANVSSTSGTPASLTWNGGGAHNGATDGVRVTATSASFSNMVVSGNAGDGIEVTPTLPPVFDQITATNNGAYGIRVTQNAGSFPGTISGSGNAVNGIYVTGILGGSAPNQKWSWGANPTFPYVVAQVTCSGPDSLEIAAGAVVKGDATSSYLNILGAGAHLRTLGTSDNPVWLTSRKDDTQGGDTNNDGGASSAAGGDWQGIYLNATADLTETWIAYGGASGWANVATTAGAASLMWNGGGTIRSADEGISGTYIAFDLDRVRVANNTGRGISISPPSGATANNCDIYDNDTAGSSYGFNNSTTTMIDATNSWWGDATGPYDPSPGPPSQNVSGLGDRVTDYVNYGSWLSAPNTNQSPYAFALVEPANGAEIMPFDVQFVWRSTTDPEGSAITYDLLVDDDPAFASPLISVSSIADTTYDAGDIGSEPGPLYWRVFARDAGGGSRLCTPASFSFMFPAGTGVDPGVGPSGRDPLAFAVRAPFPNPFRDRSTLAFTLPVGGRVRLDVFDVSGRLVRTVADGAMASGVHTLAWDGRSGSGSPVAAGVYFYRLVTGEGSSTKRTVLAR